MSGELAQRVFHFRMQAAETLRESHEAFQAWLGNDFQLDDSAITALTRLFHQQECVSETPTVSALLMECVSMQVGQEYFVHTPLPRSANEAIVRVLHHRWKHTRWRNALGHAADLGFYLLVHSVEPISVDGWRAQLTGERFADDFREHLSASDLLAQHFARVAQTGLMVLKNPLGRKRKVGGKDWSERRLFEQICSRSPDFVLLRQAEREAVSATCDLAAACRFIDQLARMPIRIRHLAQPSPLGECLLNGGFLPFRVAAVA
jgi:Lhr-like helicase